MVNKSIKSTVNNNTEHCTVLHLGSFLNKNVKNDFVLLKSECGINFLLITEKMFQTDKLFQLTIFIIKL